MKTRTALSFLLLLCVGVWIGTWARTGMSEEDTVRSLDEQERIAVLKRDVPAIERLWSDRFTVNAPNNQVVIGKRAVLESMERGVINYSSFERQVEFFRLDGDVAIIMGAETVRPIGNAPMAGQTVQRRFTNIWRQEAGTWRLFARHANMVPPR